MTLAEYLKTTGESQRAFARRAGVSATQVVRLCNTDTDVGGRTWARIELATGGLVSPSDHFPVSNRCGNQATG